MGDWFFVEWRVTENKRFKESFSVLYVSEKKIVGKIKCQNKWPDRFKTHKYSCSFYRNL